MKGTHVRTTEEHILIPLSPEERSRYEARYMWDNRSEAGEGGYGYDDASMFRDLERAERDLADERFVVNSLKKLLDGCRDKTRQLETALKLDL